MFEFFPFLFHLCNNSQNTVTLGTMQTIEREYKLFLTKLGPTGEIYLPPSPSTSNSSLPHKKRDLPERNLILDAFF